MRPSIKHLGSNLLCAIDVEATGLKPGEHEIIQICVMPLDYNLEPHSMFPPFVQLIKPENEHTISVDLPRHTKRVLKEAFEYGVDSYGAACLFDLWHSKLNLDGGKIAPLGQNWPYDAAMIRYWLSNMHFESIFHHRYRDLMVAADFVNDRCYEYGIPVMFPKLTLGSIATRLKVPFEKELMHEGAYDCYVTAKCYRALMATHLGNY